jgi:hypothetical protein
VADKQKNAKAIFSALQEESIFSWPKEDQEWFLGGAKSALDTEKLTKNLRDRLLNGAENELYGRDLNPALLNPA